MIDRTDIHYIRQDMEELIPLLHQENEIAKIRYEETKKLYKTTEYLLIVSILNLITVIIRIIS